MFSRQKGMRFNVFLLVFFMIVSLDPIWSGGANEGVVEEAKQPKTSFPEKPIQMVVGYAAGGDTDMYGRLIAAALEKKLGQPVVVTNVQGGGGSIGVQQVHDSKPDGYSVLFSHWGSLTNELNGMINYSILDDFEIPAVCLQDTSLMLIGNSKGQYKTARELFDAAKANPDTVKIGMETGTMYHLFWLILQATNDVTFHLIDTGGQPTRVAALMSQQIDAYMHVYPTVQEMIKSGDFINMGTVANERNSLYSDIPTIGEYGIKGLESMGAKYFYLALPKGTPDEIVDVYENALKDIASDEAIQQSMAKYTVNLIYKPRDEANKILGAQRETVMKYGNLLKK